ncbi:MAG: DOMON domain-containing protein [Chitinophagales bacterium]
MKIHTLFLITLYGLMASIPANFNEMKKIEKNGMKVCWQFNEQNIDFKIFAPTQGWVAIGFNESKGLMGNNLIMGKIKNGKVTISDRYIVGFGDHRAVKDLGGITHVSQISGEENSDGTSLQFSISIESMDKYHYDLLQNKAFSLLIAYSQDDDFSHHSIMRTSIDIIL